MATFRPRTLVLFVGDILSFIFSLWCSLYFRALVPPSGALFEQHLTPFSLLFVVWVAVFFIAGLYESRSIILERRRISATLLVAQIFNVAVAALFFFFVPIFGIAPKTVLIIYLAVSFCIVLLWRAFLFPLLGFQRQERAIVVGEGREVHELVAAIQHAPFAPTRIEAVIAPGRTPLLGAAVEDLMRSQKPRFVIADFNDPRVASAFPGLYNYLNEGVRFVDAMSLYEEVFGRISLPHINDQWIARNVSRYAHTLYDPVKRLMDIVVALPAGIISLILYPFIALAIVLESGRPVFISLPRVGEGGRTIHIHKFRSMTGNDAGDYGAGGVSKLRVTRVGKLLRLFRLDELPQLWEVLVGEQSLIGPRPETPALAAQYEKEIPYYQVRHLIKPGLSGWAQLYHDNHPHHGTAVEATKEKLSYDLYYLKHRSLLLDATIILKTLKKLITRSGV
jgi:lipopolysaccharide/colanic/teichoic acid biosynthesis glycosyltransferase